MGKTLEIARAANAKVIGNPVMRNNFVARIGASSHHTGGAIMGTDPNTGVLNRYLQSWDVSNLFVMGGAAFPQNAVVPGPPQAEPGTQERRGTAAWIPGSRKSAPRNDVPYR